MSVLEHEEEWKKKILEAAVNNAAYILKLEKENDMLKEALAHYRNNPPPHPGTNWAQVTDHEAFAGGCCIGLAWRLDLKLDAHDRKMLEVAGKCIARLINHQPPEET